MKKIRIHLTKNQDRNDYSMPEMTEEEQMAALELLRECVQFEPDPDWDEEELEAREMLATVDLLIDLVNGKVYRRGVITCLLEHEVTILIHLVRNCHTVCTRDELLEVYTISYCYPEVICKQIYQLRSHLGRCSVPRFEDRPYIVTMPRVGYKWNFPVIRVWKKDLNF